VGVLGVKKRNPGNLKARLSWRVQHQRKMQKKSHISFQSKRVKLMSRSRRDRKKKIYQSIRVKALFMKMGRSKTQLSSLATWMIL